MSGIQQILLGLITSGSAPAAVTWNPADKDAGLTLSNGDLTATKSDGMDDYASVRATMGRNTGKYYFEVVVDVGTTSPFMAVGVANASATLSNYVGADANGWSYYQETGTKLHSGTGTAFGAAYTTGDVVGVAYDADAGLVWFAKNNTYQASGNPAAGTGEAFSGLSGSIIPMISLHRGNVPVHQLSGAFKAADFTYSPPAGFTAWEP